MSSSVTLDPALISAVAQAIFAVVGSVAYYFVQKHVKNTDARNVILTAIENGVSFGMNKVDGALKGKPLTVDLGSQVAAQAVRYAQAAVPDAIGRLGLDPAQIAKIAVAKLPGVEGEIPDHAIAGIAAAATGKPPEGTVDIPSLVKALGTLADTINKHNDPAAKPAA